MNKTFDKLFEYEITKKLGQGAFGEVLLGTKNGISFAIKKISKKQIIKVNKLHEPFIQKQILYKLKQQTKQYPYFVKIFETQSDDDNIYLVLQYCAGGTLQQYILKNEYQHNTMKKIAARILLILQKLHSYKVIHRDIKPSNILFTQEGYVKLSDFGTAYAPDQFFSKQIAQQIKGIKQMGQRKDLEDEEQKNTQKNKNKLNQKQKIKNEENVQNEITRSLQNIELTKQNSLDSQKQQKIRQNTQTLDTFYSSQRRSTFVGTACYMAPELLQNDLCGKQADLWAYGCILYEMIFKKSPFFDVNEGMVWKKITNQEIKIQLSAETNKKQQYTQMVDLIRKLLIKDINKRLGYGQNGYNQIKKHSYFSGIQWQSQAKKNIPQIEIKIENIKEQSLQKNKQKVVFSGVVGKKAFFGNFKQRMLILYSTPKLVYFCNESGQKKGQFPLLKNTPITIDGKIFTVSNEKKTYYFKSKTSNQWVQMIKNAIYNAYY